MQTNIPTLYDIMKEGERDRTQRMIPYIYPHDGRSFKTIQSYLYFYNTEEKILFFLINSENLI